MIDSSELGMLVTLDALLQEESVTGAARRLGLSTPAVSHALARMRERFGDALLVRAGRGMVLTPRAEALREEVRGIVAQASKLFLPLEELEIASMDRCFALSVTDYVMTILGEALELHVRREAPRLDLRFIPNAVDDAERLRRGETDLAVGIYGELPPELRTRMLITERFVCVVRADHPEIQEEVTLEAYVKCAHVQVAPRGRPGGYIDMFLAEHGLSRRVARAVPFFMTALQMVAQGDYLLTISERIARLLGPSFGLKILEPPLPLKPYALSMIWHPRFDHDPGHRWLRESLVKICQDIDGLAHKDARRRLDDLDPTTGQGRKRPRKR